MKARSHQRPVNDVLSTAQAVIVLVMEVVVLAMLVIVALWLYRTLLA
jgi:hypothetical protein